MGVVKYTIVSGAAPFIAELTPSLIPQNTHIAVGTYQFLDVPNGGYTLIITDSNGCTFEQEITVDPLVTTTTTTKAPRNSIIVGNSDDVQFGVFNISATNRETHYEPSDDEYPSPLILYLWLKTLDGAPLSSTKVLNYTFTANDTSTFLFNQLSDEVHTEVLQTVSGPATTINGQLILKSGFIETFFKYTYNINSVLSSYQIDLNSNVDWLYNSIPTTGGTKIFGVTYVDRDNIIMNF